MKFISGIVCLILIAGSVAAASAADDSTSAGNTDRFGQAANRTFRAFDEQQEQAWQDAFFFLQLADTQYGMFSGDKGFDQEAALTQKAVQHINRLRPRFVIVCGDLTNAVPGHDRYEAQVGQYKQDFSGIAPEIPLVCVCGNHDIGNRPTAESIAVYKSNFGDDYFSFWVGGTCNIVLNSSVLKDPGGAADVLEAQQAWLTQQLAKAVKARAKHIFVFQHHPMFLTKPDEPDQYFNIPLIRRTALLKQLNQANVRAVFAGHYHRNSYGRSGNMEMVTTGPVGRPLGKDPSGFRVVQVFEDRIQHQYYGLDNAPESVDLSTAAPDAKP